MLRSPLDRCRWGGGGVFWGLLLSLLAGLAACDQPSSDYPARSLPMDLAEDADFREAGHRLFLEQCATCHGRSGEGRSARAGSFQPPAPDFTEKTYRQVDAAYLFWRIETGKTVEPYRSQGSVMPAWGMHLSDRQIWQVVVYLQSRAVN